MNLVTRNCGGDMALTDVKVRTAKPKEKQFKIADGDGLSLLVTPQGGKWWRFRYRFDGKEKSISLGTYPEVSLSEARERRAAARKQVAYGVDPSLARKAERASRADGENSLEAVAREWHQKFSTGWTEGHSHTTLKRLERDVFPWLGTRRIDEVQPVELLTTLQRVESRGAIETAHRIKSICGQIFRYAVATGRSPRDITVDLRNALPPANKSHLAAITDPLKVADLMRVIEGYEGSLVVKCALYLSALFFVRPGELRLAEWKELDLGAAEWNIPAERMKMKVAHLVPLSSQAVAILQELYPLTGGGRYLFPSIRSTARPMSNNTINGALRRIGYSKDEMTAHGFRALARTILDEVLQFRPDFIEHQLAHAVRDPNGRAYNRTAHLAERRKMMQVWADYLDALKVGEESEGGRNEQV